MSDLCWVCQRNNSHILRAVNVPEEMKSATLLRQEEHLRLAMQQRTEYQATCAACVELATQHNIKELGKSENPPSTFHYSFDFAQQIHYPANPLQPGPIFFKTPRRMQFFAVHAEGISRQMNYLIDEASSCGKGANVVISMVHHFLQTYGVGEDHLELHADNCSGQNKNNHMMRYLMWRVGTGLHKSACISFMVAGHTKFAPDWGFGLLKRKTRRTFVSSQADIEAATTASSICNAVQCVGTQDGDVNVPTYDWAAFLANSYRAIVGLLSYHSFSVSADVMVVREYARSPANRLVIGKGPCPTGEPVVIAPKGLSAERQAYLFKEIREFCLLRCQCLSPSLSLPRHPPLSLWHRRLPSLSLWHRRLPLVCLLSRQLVHQQRNVDDPANAEDEVVPVKVVAVKVVAVKVVAVEESLTVICVPTAR